MLVGFLPCPKHKSTHNSNSSPCWVPEYGHHSGNAFRHVAQDVRGQAGLGLAGTMERTPTQVAFQRADSVELFGVAQLHHGNSMDGDPAAALEAAMEARTALDWPRAVLHLPCFKQPCCNGRAPTAKALAGPSHCLDGQQRTCCRNQLSQCLLHWQQSPGRWRRASCSTAGAGWCPVVPSACQRRAGAMSQQHGCRCAVVLLAGPWPLMQVACCVHVQPLKFWPCSCKAGSNIGHGLLRPNCDGAHERHCACM